MIGLTDAYIVPGIIAVANKVSQIMSPHITLLIIPFRWKYSGSVSAVQALAYIYIENRQYDNLCTGVDRHP